MDVMDSVQAKANTNTKCLDVEESFGSKNDSVTKENLKSIEYTYK